MLACVFAMLQGMQRHKAIYARGHCPYLCFLCSSGSIEECPPAPQAVCFAQVPGQMVAETTRHQRAEPSPPELCELGAGGQGREGGRTWNTLMRRERRKSTSHCSAL